MVRELIYGAAMIGGIVVSGAAHAQQDDGRGVYGGLSIGVASVNDTQVEYYEAGGVFGGTGARDSVVADIELKNAAEFRGVLGYDFGPVRSDIEIAYSRNKISALTVRSLNGSAVTISPADGDEICDYLEVSGCNVSGNTISFDDGGRIHQLSAMANLWVDIPLGETITPYVGGGIGVAGFETDGEGEAKFAWQIGAGAAFNLSPSAAITADYRMRQVGRSEFPWDANSGFNVGKIRTNSFSVGLRFRF